jgi:hypothetical protein
MVEEDLLVDWHLEGGLKRRSEAVEAEEPQR